MARLIPTAANMSLRTSVYDILLTECVKRFSFQMGQDRKWIAGVLYLANA